MKKLLVRLALLSFLAPLVAAAEPITYTFRPYDGVGQNADLVDLDHYKYYVWEISQFTLAADEHILGARLEFTNIYDWINESSDRLYTHLLDITPIGLSLVKNKTAIDADLSTGVRKYDTKLLQGADSQGGGDNFAGQGVLISPVWSDPLGGLPANNVVYDFARLGGSIDAAGNIVNGSVNILATLEQYFRNGNNISFGIDPDCHYYNDKATLTITTESPTSPSPEPATMILVGSGLVMVVGAMRRKSRNGRAE